MDSLTPVERSRSMFGWRRSYSYRAEFMKATVLARVVFNEQNKLVSGQMIVMEWKGF
jgi:hypothetical protein